MSTFNQLLTVFEFVKWLIPAQGQHPRFYISLVNILICSRQSVYRHFREFKISDRRVRFRVFLSALASIPDVRQTSVPATLLARLLRTIYLTELLPRKKSREQIGGPNEGYINHPHFSYGDSLRFIDRPINKTPGFP